MLYFFSLIYNLLTFIFDLLAFIFNIKKMWGIISEAFKTRKFKLLLGIKKLDKIILTFPSFAIRCPNEINDVDMPKQAKEQRCYCHIFDSTMKAIGPGFRVLPSASIAEIRSISYLSARLKCFSLSPEILPDYDDRVDKNDTDNLISFGFECNKTKNIVNGNPFINSTNYGAFFSINGHTSSYNESDNPNIGIILRKHYDNNNEKDKDFARIACAGFNEWGTSGAAYCLAHQYKKIINGIKRNRSFFTNLFSPIPDFLCITDATPNHDAQVKIVSILIIDDKTKNILEIKIKD